MNRKEVLVIVGGVSISLSFIFITDYFFPNDLWVKMALYLIGCIPFLNEFFKHGVRWARYIPRTNQPRKKTFNEEKGVDN